ncbi:MAG: hypothetical protein ACXVXP_01055 [Mycobacteriaceae bacterium]
MAPLLHTISAGSLFWEHERDDWRLATLESMDGRVLEVVGMARRIPGRAHGRPRRGATDPHAITQ